MTNLNKTQFIEFLIQHQALKFGSFSLKSGRESPYFFNLGVFHSGSSIKQLGQFYAQALLDAKIEFDLLFGPAYKGIALATATSIALYQDYQIDIPYAFNRKEAKQHGDGGTIVGASLNNAQAVMLDDVITAGTTVRETLELFKHHSATLSGIVIAFDRQEKGQGNLSATAEIMAHTGVPIISLITLNDLIDYLSKFSQYSTELVAIKQYQTQFGV